MQWGDLRSFFRGIAWKRLSSHEVDPAVSHGHEFQGVQRLRALLGTEDRRFSVTYMLLNDDSDDIEAIRSEAQWYDSRANQPHRSAEWRLYYAADVWQIQARMHAGDVMVMAVTNGGDLVVLLAPSESTRESQLKTLFNLDDDQSEILAVRSFDRPESLGFVAASILEELGLGNTGLQRGAEADLVGQLASELGRTNPLTLPSGQHVSALIRDAVTNVDTIEDPDGALVKWIETEEALFRTWEDGVIARRLNAGFITPEGSVDVQGYRDFSMSLRQSRVSRAGTALEQHFAQILRDQGIRFDSRPSIDGGERPDFLFPGKSQYNDASFPASRLRMLAVKFTAKDRWRQVLNEAARVSDKHLLTLEAPISVNQLALMKTAHLHLVIPNPFHVVFPIGARDDLVSVQQFVSEVKSLQNA